MSNSDTLLLQLKGYRPTTAEILYRLPDYRSILQLFVWQCLDLAPGFPVVTKFLGWWEENVEGPLVDVKVGQGSPTIEPVKFRVLKPGTDFRLN